MKNTVPEPLQTALYKNYANFNKIAEEAKEQRIREQEVRRDKGRIALFIYKLKRRLRK